MSEYDFDDQPYVVIEKQETNVGSFLLGAAVGAGIALLFAPRSGAETRRDIQQRARKVRARAEHLVEDATGRVQDGYEQARARIEGRIDAARSAVELKKRQVTRAMEAGRAAAAEAREELERRIAETKAAYQAGTSVARTSAPGEGAGEEE